MPDLRSMADKMRDRYAMPGSTQNERDFAKAWLNRHGEPLTAAPPPSPGTWSPYGPGAPRAGSTPRTDEWQRAEDARREAAAQRAHAERLAREAAFMSSMGRRPTGSRPTGTRLNYTDADAFDAEMRREFMEGFNEGLGESPFGRVFTADPRFSRATRETERVRAEEARAARRAQERGMRDEMRNARENLKEQERANQRRAQETAEHDRVLHAANVEARKKARKDGRPTPADYIIEEDEAGNPIRRRQW